MGRSPLSMFRRYQFAFLVGFGCLLMFSFVVAPPLQDYLSTQAANANDRVVVTWSGAKLRESDLAKLRANHYRTHVVLERLYNLTLQKQGFPKTPFALPRYTSDRDLVDMMLLAEKARKMGMIAGDDAVNDYLAQWTDETVSGSEMQKTIRDEGLSPTGLFEQLKTEILASQLLRLATAGNFLVTPASRWENYNRINRKLKAEVLPLKVADFVEQVSAEPTASEISGLFEQYKNRLPDPNQPEPGFRIPYKAAFSYVKADFEKFREQAKAQVTQEELQRLYSERLAQGMYRRPPPPEPSSPEGPSPTDRPPAPIKQPEADPPSPAGQGLEEKTQAAPPPEGTGDPARNQAPSANPGSGDSTGQQSVIPRSRPWIYTRFQEPTPDEPSLLEPAATQVEPGPSAPAGQAQPPAENQPAAPASDAAPPATDDLGQPPSTTAPEDDREIIPLEEIRDQLIDFLASPAAQKAMNAALDKAFEEANTYFRRRTAASTGDQFDVEALAERLGLEAGRVPLVDRFEIQEYDLGKATEFENSPSGFRMVSFVERGFQPDIPLFKPGRMGAMLSNEPYVYWKTAESKERDATLEEARDQVSRAWKVLKARTLVKERAKQLADQAKEGSFRDSLGEELGAKVMETNEFSWYTRGSMPFGGGQDLMISDVEGVPRAGNDFMEVAYGLQPGQTGYAFNNSQDEMFVVRLTEKSDSESQRQQFIRTGSFVDQRQLDQIDFFRARERWLAELGQELQLNVEVPEALVGDFSR